MDSLLADVSEGIEESLWNAIRGLEEGELLLRGLAQHIKTSHNGAMPSASSIARMRSGSIPIRCESS